MQCHFLPEALGATISKGPQERVEALFDRIDSLGHGCQFEHFGVCGKGIHFPR